MSQILTVPEVAKKLSLSVHTIYKYCERGDLPYFKLKNGLRFLDSEIDGHIQKIICDQRNKNESMWKF
jgi:excisionase family DNA binding protein